MLASHKTKEQFNAIREITEEKQMYDARERASLDIQSNLMVQTFPAECISTTFRSQIRLGGQVISRM